MSDCSGPEDSAPAQQITSEADGVIVVVSPEAIRISSVGAYVAMAMGMA